MPYLSDAVHKAREQSQSGQGFVNNEWRSGWERRL